MNYESMKTVYLPYSDIAVLQVPIYWQEEKKKNPTRHGDISVSTRAYILFLFAMMSTRLLLLLYLTGHVFAKKSQGKSIWRWSIKFFKIIQNIRNIGRKCRKPVSMSLKVFCYIILTYIPNTIIQCIFEKLFVPWDMNEHYQNELNSG